MKRRNGPQGREREERRVYTRVSRPCWPCLRVMFLFRSITRKKSQHTPQLPTSCTPASPPNADAHIPNRANAVSPHAQPRPLRCTQGQTARRARGDAIEAARRQRTHTFRKWPAVDPLETTTESLASRAGSARPWTRRGSRASRSTRQGASSSSLEDQRPIWTNFRAICREDANGAADARRPSRSPRRGQPAPSARRPA